MRTLKEQLLWVRRFKNVEELRLALHDFKEKYNNKWKLERYGHLSPKRVYENFLAAQAVA